MRNSIVADGSLVKEINQFSNQAFFFLLRIRIINFNYKLPDTQDLVVERWE